MREEEEEDISFKLCDKQKIISSNAINFRVHRVTNGSIHLTVKINFIFNFNLDKCFPVSVTFIIITSHFCNILPSTNH